MKKIIFLLIFLFGVCLVIAQTIKIVPQDNDAYINEYFPNISPDSEFIFKERPGKDNEIIEAHYRATKSGVYEIGNLEFYVPKNSRVDFKNSMIIVSVSSRSEIKEPRKINSDKETVKIKYVVKAGESVSIEGIGEIKGGLDADWKNKDLELFFNVNEKMFFVESAEINKIEFGVKSSVEGDARKIYIVTESVDDFEHAFFYYDKDNKKVEFGVPKDHKGIYVEFLSGNEIVDVKSGKRLNIGSLGAGVEKGKSWTDKSRIVVVNPEYAADYLKSKSRSAKGYEIDEEKVAYIDTKGSFVVRSGSKIVKYNPVKGNPVYASVKEERGSVGVRIHSSDSNGEQLSYKGKKKINGKIQLVDMPYDFDVFINERGDAYFRKGDEIELSTRVKINDLEKDYIGKLLQASSEDYLRIIKLTSTKDIKNAINNLIPKYNLDLKKSSYLKKYDTQPIFEEILNEKYDISTQIHEQIHLLQGEIDIKKGYRAVYLGNGYYVFIKDTGVKKSRAIKYVPNSLNKITYSNYFSGDFKNRDLNHVFEDAYPYQLGAKAAFDYTKRTGKVIDSISEVQGVLTPVIHSSAAGMMLESSGAKNPNSYWKNKEGEEFRGLLKRTSEDAMKIFWQSQEGKLQNYAAYSKNIINNLRTNSDSSDMRKFLIRTYGSDWTYKTFGFKYAEGSKNKKLG